MTLAERIRIEKSNAVNFDAVLFMQIIEEYFKSHDCTNWLEVKACDNYKAYDTHPYLRGDNLWVNFHNKEYQCLDFIGVPSEHIFDAWNLLRKEGFILYRVNQYIMKVALFDAPYINYGYNTWFKA